MSSLSSLHRSASLCILALPYSPSVSRGRTLVFQWISLFFLFTLYYLTASYYHTPPSHARFYGGLLSHLYSSLSNFYSPPPFKFFYRRFIFSRFLVCCVPGFVCLGCSFRLVSQSWCWLLLEVLSGGHVAFIVYIELYMHAAVTGATWDYIHSSVYR